MKLKGLFSCILSGCVTVLMYGQGTVNYKITKNNPEKKFVFIEAGLFYVEASNVKDHEGEAFGRMGVPLSAEYVHKQKFSLKLHTVLVPYLDFTKPYITPPTENQFQKYKQLELGGSYIFGKNLKDRSTRFDLSEKGISRSTIQTTLVMVPSKIQLYHKLRAGYYTYTQNIQASSHGSLYQHGPVSSYYVLSDSIPFGDLEDNNIPDGMTSMKVNGAYIGYERMVVHHLFANVAGYKRKKTGYNAIYADLLFGKTDITPFEYLGRSYPITEGFESRSVGWRAGWKLSYSLSEYVNLFANMEAGSKPGLKIQGVYFNLSSGISIYI